MRWRKPRTFGKQRTPSRLKELVQEGEKEAARSKCLRGQREDIRDRAVLDTKETGVKSFLQTAYKIYFTMLF